MKSKSIIFLALFSAVLISCGQTRYVPVKEEVIYIYKDSVTYHDSTIFVEVPKERIVDVVPQYDTLRLETSLAESTAYVDTLTHTLKGEIRNTLDSIPTEIKWKEKVVYRDSVVVKEVPVEVTKEVTKIPSSYWLWLSISIIFIAYIAFKIWSKFKTLL